MFGLHPLFAAVCHACSFFSDNKKTGGRKELAIQKADPSVNPAGRQQMRGSE